MLRWLNHWIEKYVEQREVETKFFTFNFHKQLHDTLSFLVTIKDRLDPDHDSENDNLVKVPINVIVLDENDNSPTFQNVPYECEISEDALPGTTVFDSIWVTDKDKVGENLNVTCLPQSQNLNACQMFVIRSREILIESVDENSISDFQLRQ